MTSVFKQPLLNEIEARFDDSKNMRRVMLAGYIHFLIIEAFGTIDRVTCDVRSKS